MAHTVGLIIPAYNRAASTAEAIESALNQTRVPDEIVVVDDGSTDGTWDMLQQYAAPVRPIRHPTNRGRSAARNTGIAHCSADFICFLDSDDLLGSDSIKTRADWLEAHPEDMVVYSYIERADFDGNPVTKGKIPAPWPSGHIFAEIARHGAFSFTAFMMRRACLPEPPYFDEQLARAEDRLFLLRVTGSYPARYVDGIAAIYRFHPQMSMASENKMIDDVMTVQERIYQMDAFRSLPPKTQARIYCSHAITRIQASRFAQARRCLQRSMTTAPTYPTAYVFWPLSWLGKHPIGTAMQLRQNLIAKRRWGATEKKHS
jgi:glycosyltransferase involved in cell wall biosynthesis